MLRADLVERRAVPMQHRSCHSQLSDPAKWMAEASFVFVWRIQVLHHTAIGDCAASHRELQHSCLEVRSIPLSQNGPDPFGGQKQRMAGLAPELRDDRIAFSYS